jgi:predicted ATPase
VDELFDVTDLVNKGSLERRVGFAELNLRAAEKARSISAFSSAAMYVARGIEPLSKDKWTDHRDVALRLYTIGAEMELALGHVDRMESYSNEVFSQDCYTTMDKFPLYLATIYKLSTMDLKYVESIEYCLLVLKELMGSRMVAFRALLPLQAIFSLKRAIKVAKNTPRETYKILPKMTDPKQKAIMRVLYRLASASYLAKNIFMLLLTTSRMFEITLKHGVSDVSGAAFCNLGYLTVLDDCDTAHFFGEMALLMQGRAHSKFAESYTLFHVYALVFPWTKPLQSCILPLTEAITSGLQAGNSDFATWALLMNHVQLPYQIGKPLDPILANCPNDLSQIEELKQQDQSVLFRMHWQLMLNLTGQSRETTKLKGDIFNCEDFVPETSFQDVLLDLMQMELYIFFGDFERGAELALRIGDNYEKAAPGYFLQMLETFHRGIALYAMARRTGKAKYRKPANRIRKTIKKWMVSGNPNVRHYHYLLRAELAALDKDNEAADAFYRDAIKLAARTGHLHHAALFNERYADFLRHNVLDDYEADYRIEEAIRFYKAWGAQGKVRILATAC